jgi:bifunctional DNA-binding transcriptional regulator/antitoxin component of YhaV-PrlF toxin-antitoxin module
MKIQAAGEVKISGRGAVNLPARTLREVGWKHGDQLFVDIVDGNRIVLSRRPEDIVEYFAGCLTHLYPDPEDTRRFLEEERASWDEFDRRLDG